MITRTTLGTIAAVGVAGLIAAGCGDSPAAGERTAVRAPQQTAGGTKPTEQASIWDEEGMFERGDEGALTREEGESIRANVPPDVPAHVPPGYQESEFDPQQVFGEGEGPEQTAETPTAMPGEPIGMFRGTAGVEPRLETIQPGTDAAGKVTEMSAASDRLPADTILRVVNPETNQAVVVRIDERFAEPTTTPAGDVRLSPAAAQRVGIIGDRPMPVRIELLQMGSGSER